MACEVCGFRGYTRVCAECEREVCLSHLEHWVGNAYLCSECAEDRQAEEQEESATEE